MGYIINKENFKMKKKNRMIRGIVLLLIGIALLIFNSVFSVCTGWNMINPLCWGGSIIIHTILFLGGIILIIVGLVSLIRKNKR